MNLKVLTTVKTKKQLYELYLPYWSERHLRFAINDIVKSYRPFVGNKCKNITFQEFLTFVELYGAPEGYTLSSDLQTENKNRKLKV